MTDIITSAKDEIQRLTAVASIKSFWMNDDFISRVRRVGAEGGISHGRIFRMGEDQALRVMMTPTDAARRGRSRAAR